MHRTLTTLAMTLALAAVMGTPLSAQDARLTGTVTDTFGTEIILDTGTDRLLVTLPENADTPVRGSRLDISGTRTGDRFVATAVTATAATATADATGGGDDSALPTALRGLGLTDIRSRRDDDETYHVGRLPDGGWLRAEAKGDTLKEVQTDGAPLPDALVAALLPAAAQAETRLADIARLTEIDTDDDEIEVKGYAADGMRIEIEFTRDGRFKKYERERDGRRSLTEAEARARLATLGYTDVGYVDRRGRHVEALAVNPYGETVEVRLNRDGQVERERLWQR